MGQYAGSALTLTSEDNHLESWGTVTRGSSLTSTNTSVDPFALRPGRIISLEGPTGLGLTRVGLSMIADASQHAPVVIVDVRGWICPLAAWETGVRSDRLVIVRCGDVIQWPGALAALLEGVKAIYAEVPIGVPGGVLRRLSALARSRNAGLVLRPLKGQLPSGVAYLRVRAEKVVWTGAQDGHGQLDRRKVELELSGKGTSGMQQAIEMEDDGTHIRKDNVRVVSRLAVATSGRAAG